MTRAATVPLPVELRNVLAKLSAVELADDQAWLLSLMRKQGLAVITMLWRMLGAEQDVLDAYQTAICRLTARGQDGLGRNPAGYFYRTASNAGIEILRARQRRRNNWPAVIDTQRALAERAEAAGLDQRETLEQMRRAICDLPPHLRNTIILRELAELPYGQVASILGIGLGTARLYRRQAIVRLAELMGKRCQEAFSHRDEGKSCRQDSAPCNEEEVSFDIQRKRFLTPFSPSEANP